ncbi:hypothetical protein BDV26DRAFT_293645 [Aspergillus bertholletiae]|uniref:Uncharacterized protein n=1 Tax=Aspergillus bertholletiae TaxID=1226010 RepID=A0A5N7B4W9_9EURO|nr:hypothetical protein BDV26DRAFT_293645 [Aspergillus bertholletiae]
MPSQQEPKPETIPCLEDPSSKIQGSINPVPQLWEPGMLKRLPLLGISALLDVLACLKFNITILLVSNGKPQSNWKVRSSVLLAISSALSTGLLRFALAEGAAITWWNKAIDGIASVIVAIDSPLFQRAITATVQPAQVNIPLAIGVAQQLPSGYTGAMQRHIIADVTRMTPPFQKAVLSHNSGEPMYLNNSGYANGNCSTAIRAAGLAVNCSLSTLPLDFGSLLYVFNFTAAYKDQKDCNSRLQVNRCAFHLATLFYPINLVDGVIEFSSPLEDLVRYGEVRYRDGNIVLPNEDVGPNDNAESRLELSHLHWTSTPQQESRYV